MTWDYLVFLGATVQLIGIWSYTKETLQGKTKPNRVSWLMWAVTPLIGAFAIFSNDAGLGSLPLFISGTSALVVFFVSFINPHAYWKLETFDYLCGFFSFLALTLWVVTKEPFVAVILAIVSDIFATMPTLIKAWKYPTTETPLAYTTGMLNASTSFAALRNWNFTNVVFPIYWISVNLLILSFLHRQRLSRK